MKDLRNDRWLAGVLFFALVVSFLLCVASDLRFSALLNDMGRKLPVSAGSLSLGLSWIIGHGLHGAAVIAVPIFVLRRDNSAGIGVEGRRDY